MLRESGRTQAAPARQRKDVELAWIGRVGKGRCRHAEVLRKHIGRHMLEPIADQEGVVFGKAAVVEHEQKLAAVGLQPWIECGMPAGKYQRSPTPTSSTKLRPSW